ncbi:MAG: AmmeMemoRadiSam system protein A [Omnitrophica WOR_2 bacterium]
MMPVLLSSDERAILLKLAREALESGVRGETLLPLDLESLPPCLGEPGATFVTLTRQGELRGCIGALEARLPLAEDVREHAIAAALEDYRFPPVSPDELPDIDIEISRLTPPVSLPYADPQDLVERLCPHQDGVILKSGFRRATFLPQVWEKIPDPALFLSYLCQKMGASPDLWQRQRLEVYIYHVEEFHSEKNPGFSSTTDHPKKQTNRR